MRIADGNYEGSAAQRRRDAHVSAHRIAASILVCCAEVQQMLFVAAAAVAESVDVTKEAQGAFRGHNALL